MIVLLLNEFGLLVVINELTVIVAVTASSTLVLLQSAAGIVPLIFPVMVALEAIEPVKPTVNVPDNVPLFTHVFPGAKVTLAGKVVVVAESATGVEIWNPKVAPVLALAKLAAPVVIVKLGTDVKLPSVYMFVPAKDAAVIWFETPNPEVNPDAEIRTEVPAGPVEGLRVTVGAVIVNVAACGAATESEICTE